MFGTDYRDNVYGLDGNDQINAGKGNDHIHGGTGDDNLNGSEGSDSYYWKTGDGADTISDGPDNFHYVDTLLLTDVQSANVTLTRDNLSNDLQITILGSTTLRVSNQFFNIAERHGIERIVFGDGEVWNLADILENTTVEGTGTANSLFGTFFDDNISGGGGSDTINTGEGDDTLNGGTGNDLLLGGNGDDQYVWSNGDGSDTISDADTELDDIDTLFLQGIQPGNINLRRPDGSNTLEITGLGGATLTILNQFFQGNQSQSWGVEGIDFGNGLVWTLEDILANTPIEGSTSADLLQGTVGRDIIEGYAGNDTLAGSDGDDTLRGGDQTDTLNGGLGADVLDGGAGADLLDGGGGFDTAFYGTASFGVTADLQAAYNNTGDAAGDTYVGIEWLVGSDFGDTLSGNEVDNFIWAGSRNDLVEGRAGNDSLNGENGSDTLVGGAGADTLNGGSGTDRASYYNATSAVTADLQNPGINTSDAAGDVYISIEDLRGSNQNDNLRGDSGSNYLIGANGDDFIFGRGGTDTLKGGSGNDRLDGGGGDDRLLGGSGSDEFIFGTNTGTDRIRGGFETDLDIILINGIADPNDVTISVQNGDTFFDFGSSTVIVEGHDGDVGRWLGTVVNGNLEYEYTVI